MGDVQRQREILAASYGQYVPLRMQMESQILSQFRRLPTLPSSMLGLDTLGNRHQTLGISDVFGECGANRGSAVRPTAADKWSCVAQQIPPMLPRAPSRTYTAPWNQG